MQVASPQFFCWTTAPSRPVALTLTASSATRKPAGSVQQAAFFGLIGHFGGFRELTTTRRQSQARFLDTTGAVWTCGFDKYGQLGNGTVGVDTELPGRANSGADMISTTGHHALDNHP